MLAGSPITKDRSKLAEVIRSYVYYCVENNIMPKRSNLVGRYRLKNKDQEEDR